MKTTLISGASRGIGKAIAEQLYADGFNISLGVRNTEKVSAIFNNLDSSRLQIVPYDALKLEDAEKWVNAAIERFSRIDVLVNCAWIARANSIEEFSVAALDEM